MQTWIMRALFAAFVIGAAVAVRHDIAAQQKPEWIMRDFYTLQNVTDFLNTLPADKASDAKVLAANSNRSLGWLGNPYVVWYRK